MKWIILPCTLLVPFKSVFIVVTTATYGSVYPPLQAAYLNSTVKLKCNSLTTPKWTLTNTREKKSIEAHQLKFTKINERATGTYTCQGTKYLGSNVVHFQATAEILVGVKSNKLITTQRNIYLIDSVVQLECNTWTMTIWFHQDLKSPISYSRVLTLSEVTRKDSGTYFCFGDYEHRAGYFIGSTVIDIIGDHKVKFGTVYPKHQVVLVNEPIKFTCGSITEPTWLKEGKHLIRKSLFYKLKYFFSDRIIKNKYNIIIKHAKSSDSGIYSCKGTKIIRNERINFIAEAYILVGVKDNNHISPSIVKVYLRGVAKFTCESHSVVRWYHNSLMVTPIAQTPTISISSVFPDDAGIYYCVGYKRNQRLFVAEAKLEVVDWREPQLGEVFPVNQILYVGQNIFIKCGSLTKPNWLKDNVNIYHVRDYSLKIYKVAINDSGIYTCDGTHRVSGILRNFLASAVVVVKDLQMDLPY